MSWFQTVLSPKRQSTIQQTGLFHHKIRFIIQFMLISYPVHNQVPKLQIGKRQTNWDANLQTGLGDSPELQLIFRCQRLLILEKIDTLEDKLNDIIPQWDPCHPQFHCQILESFPNWNWHLYPHPTGGQAGPAYLRNKMVTPFPKAFFYSVIIYSSTCLEFSQHLAILCPKTY